MVVQRKGESMETKELKPGESKLVIAGKELKVDLQANIAETVKVELKTQGIDSFTLTIDGKEVKDTNDIPEKFDGHNVEVDRYTKPGMLG